MTPGERFWNIYGDERYVAFADLNQLEKDRVEAAAAAVVADVQGELATLRRVLSAICANYPQRQQMLPHVQRAMELLKTECSNCGTVTMPWEGHSPCNPVLPQLRDENVRLRKILAHVPGMVALKAKEDAGYGDAVTAKKIDDRMEAQEAAYEMGLDAQHEGDDL